MILALLGCREGGRGGDDPDHSGRPRSLPERCPESPCVTELASAVADEPGEGDEGGQVVVVAEEWAFVQAPGVDVHNHVSVFHLPELDWVGQWEADQLASGALVAGDVTGDGQLDLLVGRPYDPGEGTTEAELPHVGSVMLVDRLPSEVEDLSSNAVLSFAGPRQVGVGPGISLADVDGDSVADLTVSGLGHCCHNKTFEPSGVWVFDPNLRGTLTESAAKLHYEGVYGRWNALLVHDLEGDGEPELWETRGVLLGHRLPLSDGDPDLDAVVNHLTRSRLADSFALGDVTGDGLADLATYFLDHPDDDRAGVLYVLPGGWDMARAVDDSAIRVTGSRVGDAMGVAAVSADVTGDGVLDLVVGASGVFPGQEQPGRVLVFAGPIDGALTESDAVAAVVGEYAGDHFGREVAVTDADGDAKADLVIGAFGYPGGYADGRVYVVPGAALVP